ncbi:MAG: 3-phosphoshikimate 1-carboxyvinyltransferase [Acidimicrobiia bacterium]
MVAVRPLGRPVSGLVRPPGSKSLTNRALVLASLARTGVSRIGEPLEADDTGAMRRCLRGLGVMIDDNDDPWLVLGAGDELRASDALDVGASGTTARFVTAVACLARGRVTIDGSSRMRQRPMAPLVHALEAMGARLESSRGRLPIHISGGELTGGRVTVDATQSSQFASAVLMVAPMAESAVEVVLAGPVVSRPYLIGTVEMMRLFGAEVETDDDRFHVAPTGYHKAAVTIEADASAAVYPAVAAAITGGSVAVVGIPAGSSQPDLAVLEVLSAMGCEVMREPDRIVVRGPGEPLGAVEADLDGAPDGALAVAVAALFADGPSRLTGLSTLRLKESDRLAALEDEIEKMGGQARAGPDYLEIRPRRLHAAIVDPHDDHRIAMSLALVGLVVPGIEISDPGTVAKTWPGYFEMLKAL